MLTLENLREYGANVDEGLERCMNNKDFYIRLVGIALGDKNHEQLKEAIENNDLDKAFESAHALKGMLGNLSLTPMYKPVLEMTELLRSRTEMDYSPLLGEFLEQRRKLEELAAD